MMRKFALLALIVAFAAACGGKKGTGEPIVLKYKFEAGQSLPYLMKMTGAMHLDYKGDKRVVDMMRAGSPSEIKFEMDMGMTMITDSVLSDGAASISMTIGKYEMRMFMGDSVIDTSNPQMAEMVKLMQSMKPSMVIEPFGKVRSVAGMEQMMMGMGSSDMSQQLSQMQPVFPEKGVRVGESWEQEFNQEMPAPNMPGANMTMTVKVKYTLTGVEQEGGHDVAVIATHMTLTMKTSGDTPMMGDMKMSGEGDGTMRFDVTAGYLSASDVDMKTKMEMTMDQGGQKITMLMDMDMDMNMSLSTPEQVAAAPAQVQ